MSALLPWRPPTRRSRTPTSSSQAKSSGSPELTPLRAWPSTHWWERVDRRRGRRVRLVVVITSTLTEVDMRLVATEYLSLDGVFEEPGEWSGPFFNDEAAQFKLSELQASDALLLGRNTYEGFAAAWPSMTDEAGFSDKMNTMPKYVVSSSLDKLEWPGSRLV